MKSFGRFVAILGGVVGCTAAAGAMSIGCGSSSHGTSAEEAGADGTVEDAPAASEDAPMDAPNQVQLDASSDVQSGQPDATVDAQGDAAIDAQADGQADAPSDTGSDAADSEAVETGAGEAGLEASAPIFAFPGQVATALCHQLASCCFGQDASAFDMATCITNTTPVGYSGTLLGSAGRLDSGVLAFDPAKAQACLNDIASIDCTANELTTQVQISVLDDCVAALYGTLGSGAACAQAIQCAPGEFCDLPSDGGSGACAPLRGDGGSCTFGSNGYGSSEEACSFRRTGSSGLRCNNADLTTGNPFPTSTWTCTPEVEAGSGCNFNQDCQSELCDPTLFVCANALPFVSPAACAGYVLKDAGGGG